MFPAGKAADAKAFDERAIKSGIPSILLMENAAFSLFLEVSKIIEKFKIDKIVLFAGRGGNGGDGFALLRILIDRGCTLPMFVVPFFSFQDRLPLVSEDSFLNWKILPETVKKTELKEITGKVLFVDAMIGTGLKRNLDGEFKEGVEFINSYKDKFVLTIDVPTGLNSDTGRIMGTAVAADVTVTMGIYKTGLFAENGPKTSGKIVLGKISACESKLQNYSYYVEENLSVKSREIPIDSYKNKNGHLLVVGGEIDKLGATIIAARAFMASGGGLVTAAFEKKLHDKIAGVMPGMMLADIEQVPEILNNFDSIVIGPGLLKFPFKDREIFKSYKGTVVVDAGMFDIINEYNDLLNSFDSLKTVFTPHAGELRRFLKATGNEPWINQIERFPLKKEQILVAKSHSTFIKDIEKTVVIPHGAKALSFGGSGDALAGIIACETFFDGLSEGVKKGVIKHRAAGIELERKYSASFHDIDKLVEVIGIAGKKNGS
ncbi:MAG: NAD(P)H-hydrate epimerase [bacterium]